MNTHENKTELSACCGKISRLSISTRHGRRLFCELCGKPFIPQEKECECKDTWEGVCYHKIPETSAPTESKDWMDKERNEFWRSYAPDFKENQEILFENITNYWLARIFSLKDQAYKEGYEKGVCEMDINVIKQYNHALRDETSDLQEMVKDVGREQGKAEERNRIRKMIEGMKRTDETQMNDDHVYDEALSELLNNLDKEL